MLAVTAFATCMNTYQTLQTALQLLSDACREAAAKFNFTPDQLELEQIYVGKGRSQKKLRVRTLKHTVARHSDVSPSMCHVITYECYRWTQCKHARTQ
jgi:ribosomal protein L22